MNNENTSKILIRNLTQLRIPGIAQAYADQLAQEDQYVHMPFAERFNLIVETALEDRQNRKVEKLLRHAQLPSNACLENLDTASDRGLDLTVINTLKDNAYLDSGHNIIIAGATGSGKTFLASAFAAQACRAGRKARYYRTADLLAHMHAAEKAGDLKAFLRDLNKNELLILDEFLLVDPTADDTRLLYELASARHRIASTLMCSNFHIDGWYTRFGGTPLAESLLDRLRNPAFVLTLKGRSSLREKYEQPDLLVAVRNSGE